MIATSLAVANVGGSAALLTSAGFSAYCAARSSLLGLSALLMPSKKPVRLEKPPRQYQTDAAVHEA